MAGLSPPEFAQNIGIGRSSWNNIENAFSRIGIDAGLKFCDEYNVSLDWIYQGDDRLLTDDLKKCLKIAEDRLTQQSTDDTEEVAIAETSEEPPANDDGAYDGFLAIAEANRRLARSLGIRLSSIKITIEA